MAPVIRAFYMVLFLLLITISSLALLLKVSVPVTSTSGQLLKAENQQIHGFTKADQGAWNGPYIFIHATDPQPGLVDMVGGGNGAEWSEEIRRLEQAVTAINNMEIKPKFIFISGDIVNAFPGEEPYRTEQTKDVNTVLSKITIPTMVLSGNHDLLNAPTHASVELFRKQYGDDYYSFYCGGVFYIALNSQYFFNSSLVSDLAQEQMDWLDKELNKAKDDSEIHGVVILMHIPVFLQKGDEPDNYFNIPHLLRMLLIDKFMDAGVKIVFSGHYHCNAGGIWMKTVKGKKLQIESVVTSAIGAQLGQDEYGLRVVKVREDRITHKYYSMTDLPINTVL